MDLQNLRTLGMPLAREMVGLRQRLSKLQSELSKLLAPNDPPWGYAGALLIAAEFERGAVDAAEAAERMSRMLDIYDVYCTAAAKAMPPLQQIELMLIGRFEAATKGN